MAASEAQKKASEKYRKANLEEVRFRVRKGTRDKIAARAAAQGKSLAGYIKDLISTEMGEEIR